MLDKIFTVGLTGLGLFLPFSIALSSLAYFPLLALWLLGGSRTLGRWPAVWGRTEKTYAIFLGISLLSSIVGMDWRHSAHEIYKKDLYILILVLIAAVVRRPDQ